MKSWAQGLEKPENRRIVSYLGPVGLAIGAICVLNAFNVAQESIGFRPTSGILNLIAGGVFILLGIVLSLSLREKVVFARAFLPVGLSIFFWGTQVLNTYNAVLAIKLGVGIGMVVMGITFMVIGFKWRPK